MCVLRRFWGLPASCWLPGGGRGGTGHLRPALASSHDVFAWVFTSRGFGCWLTTNPLRVASRLPVGQPRVELGHEYVVIRVAGTPALKSASVTPISRSARRARLGVVVRTTPATRSTGLSELLA